MSYPRIVADRKKLRHNADTILSWCSRYGVQAAFVGKCVCADGEILPMMLQRGFAAYADSREENLERAETSLPRLLLRIGMADRAAEIVHCAELSLQSEIDTIHALGRAARKAGRRHKVILMVDLGDLREGIWYEDYAGLRAAAQAVLAEEALELYGTGTNLTCYGSVIPDEKNLGELVTLTRRLRRELGEEIPLISGGNSSSLGLLRAGRMPEGVNFLRIGEAALLGTDTATGGKFPELWDDAFILEAKVAELKTKPSRPVGVTSVNAFGEHIEYEDKGLMRRGILAVGRQDFAALDGLTPLDERIEIVGGSSDHLIVDLTRAEDVALGGVVRFKLSYGALLALFTSEYVSRDYL